MNRQPVNLLWNLIVWFDSNRKAQHYISWFLGFLISKSITIILFEWLNATIALIVYIWFILFFILIFLPYVDYNLHLLVILSFENLYSKYVTSTSPGRGFLNVYLKKNLTIVMKNKFLWKIFFTQSDFRRKSQTKPRYHLNVKICPFIMFMLILFKNIVFWPFVLFPFSSSTIRFIIILKLVRRPTYLKITYWQKMLHVYILTPCYLFLLVIMSMISNRFSFSFGFACMYKLSQINTCKDFKRNAFWNCYATDRFSLGCKLRLPPVFISLYWKNKSQIKYFCFF